MEGAGVKKVCPECHKVFVTELADKVYCSRKCSVKMRKRGRSRRDAEIAYKEKMA